MAASLSLIFGIIGNVFSICMFLSPVATFKRIVKKKSIENYKGLPYVTTLLSTSLWCLYGMIKPGALLVVTVNGAGTLLHIVYVSLFILYAPKDVKVQTIKMVALVDVGFFGAVVAVSLIAIPGDMQLTVVGIISAALTVGMYAAPLGVMKTVIKTKSVEYMPFFLSFFQFLNGGIWASYALVIKDVYMGVPNGIGFLLSSAQILLYLVYRNRTPSKSSANSEEEGSAHQGRGKLEMQDLDEKEKKNRGRRSQSQSGN